MADQNLAFTNERPPFSVVPPAISRHLMFRFNRAANPRTVADDKVKECWVALCDNFQSHLQNVVNEFEGDGQQVAICDPDGLTTHKTPEDVTKLSVTRTMPLTITEAGTPGYRCRIRLDVYTELFTITYLVDKIKSGSELARPFETLRPENIDGAIELDYLYELWWRDEFRAAGVISEWLENEDGLGALGTLHADFRSVIINADPNMDLAKVESKDFTALSGKSMTGALGEFLITHRLLVEAAVGKKHVGDEVAALDKVSTKGGEAVLGGMAGGAAIYAARLGQWAVASDITPIRHLLVYDGRSRAQLGRLLRRLQVLGELRHAALFDWDRPQADNLRKASRELLNLGDQIDAETSRAVSGTPAATASARMTALRNLISNYGKISSAAKDGGGLAFRVEQSRYYAEAFKLTLDELREVRIGDWQPYGDFIRRYIFQLFSRIDRIGVRHVAAGRRIDQLLYFAQVQSLDGYQDAVQGSLTELGKATSHLDQNARKHTRLLESAEAFAYLFGAYYLGSIVDHAIETSYRVSRFAQQPVERFLAIWRFIWFFLGLAASINVLLTLYWGKQAELAAKDLMNGNPDWAVRYQYRLKRRSAGQQPKG